MRKLVLKSLSLRWIILIFIVGCNKDKEYQEPGDYSLSNWKFSVADNDWNDTLATPLESGFQYRIFYTNPGPPYEDKSYVLQHYVDENLVQHQTVEWVDRVAFDPNYSLPRTTYHFMNGAGRLDFFTYGSNAYTYGFPYDKINGVKVKNIFGR